jgi:serine/threonine protein kinase/lipoprotein NlpI
MDSDEPKLGEFLGHYRIISVLGEGGMGKVYLAEDTKLIRNVAVKVLPWLSAGDESARKRLLREARAAAALDHPNICGIHEVGEAKGSNYIAMQYVEGETLDVLLKRGALSCEESLTIATQIADALAEAHDHKVIHRDIKPQNIMVTRRRQVKILDFGIAKVVSDGVVFDSEAETKSLLTQAGVIIGTVPYMSPEQVKGEAVDVRSDIFSFGSVLYEMLSGRRPFAANTTAEIISAILTREPQAFASYSIVLPAALEHAVRKCLEKDREDRFQTMREVGTHLENIRRAFASGSAERLTVDHETPTVNRALAEHGKASHLVQVSRWWLAVAFFGLLVASGFVYVKFSSRQRAEPKTSAKSVNSVAYDFYLRGRVNAGSENRTSNENAIRLLEQAIAADPNLPEAYAELARAYGTRATYFASGAERKKLTEDAEVAVAKAFALNPDLPEAYLARGLLLWTHDNRFPSEQAIQAYKRAISLQPKLDEAHNRLGVIYFHIGLLDKAWGETEKALEINPANTNARFRFGVISIYRTKYEDALTLFKSIPRETNPALVDRNIATALFQLGRTDEAATVVDEYLKTYPSDEGGNVTSVKAMLLAKSGKEREAEEMIARAAEIGLGFVHFHHTAYNIASAYALLNKPDEAIKWLQVAADDGFPCYPFFEKDANLNSLRNNERFKAFMAKLKEQWERYQATL